MNTPIGLSNEQRARVLTEYLYLFEHVYRQGWQDAANRACVVASAYGGASDIPRGPDHGWQQVRRNFRRLLGVGEQDRESHEPGCDLFMGKSCCSCSPYKNEG